MVLKYFLPEKDFNWEELEKLTAKKEGLWTWTMAGTIALKKMGFEIVNMEEFDYLRMAQEGEKYLAEKNGEETAKIQVAHCDIRQEMKLAKEFYDIFGNQNNLPEIKDIKNLLEDGYLVTCHVNFRILNEKEGYTGHFVVIIGFDDENLYLHDPGLPPQENRKVTNDLFLKAWAYPNEAAKYLVAFKYSK